MNIDFEEVYNNLTDDKIISLLGKLGVPLIENKSNYLIFPTACHNGNIEEASHKLYFYKNSKHFYCYTECGDMTIYQFLKHFYETRGYDYSWEQDIYGAVVNCVIPDWEDQITAQKVKLHSSIYKKNILPDLPTYPNSIINVFIKQTIWEWINDGISSKTMDKYNIRYSPSENKIIIPHYNIDGNLVGIRGRALEQSDIEMFGKYMPVKIEHTWYNHQLSYNLYGLNYNFENIKKYGYVYIFEAE